MEDDRKVTICRICINGINATEKCFCLFKSYEDLLVPGVEHDNILIMEKIIAVAKVDIVEDDGLPSSVCFNCLRELEVAYNFRRKCEKSDSMLRIAYSNNQDIKTNEFVNARDVVVSTELKEDVEIEQDNSEELVPELGNDQSDDNKSLDFNYENDDKHLNDDTNGSVTNININKIEFQCELCNDYSSCESKLQVHLRKEHKQFSCSDCKTQFNTYGALRYHRRNNNCKTKNKKNICINKIKLIPASTVIQNDICNKLRQSRTIDLNLECDDCGSLFKSKCKLRVHWKKEHLLFTCQSCKMKFRTYKALKNHQNMKSIFCSNSYKMRIEEEEGVLVYNCKECDYKTMRKESMIQHFIVHSNNHRFKCDLCPKTYLRNQQLRIHKEYVHQTYVFEKTCHICGELIIGYHKIKYHYKKHKGKQLVQCDICKKTFVHKTYLIYHIAKEHMGLEKYPCDVCNKLFNSKYLANSHKNRFHSGQSYSCSICGYTSPNRYNINSHEKKHNGNNVGCSDCGKFLENDTQLRLHKQRHMLKKLVCEHCKVSFFDRKSYSCHLRISHNIYLSKGGLGKVTKKVKSKKK